MYIIIILTNKLKRSRTVKGHKEITNVKASLEVNVTPFIFLICNREKIKHNSGNVTFHGVCCKYFRHVKLLLQVK